MNYWLIVIRVYGFNLEKFNKHVYACERKETIQISSYWIDLKTNRKPPYLLYKQVN
jgi:hypothetical protein